MLRRPGSKPNSISQAAIDRIRALRLQDAALLSEPERFLHDLIQDSNGNVRLQIREIVRELGLTMRTLLRAFTARYGQTIDRCQEDVRLEYAKRMLRTAPPSKNEVIAKMLGYDHVQGFNRFFKKHTKKSPGEWARTAENETRR
jgi:AraC-like DNA-binding protein